jgi:hypothetical protein
MPQNPTLCWLALSCLVTGLLFLPYVLNRIARQGLVTICANQNT